MKLHHILKQCFSAAAVATALFAAVPAQAEVQWAFSRSACSGQLGSSGIAADMYNSCLSSGNPSSAPDSTVTAFANTGGNAATSGSTSSTTNPSNFQAQTIETAYMGVYSNDPANLGVVNRDYATRTGNSLLDANESGNPEHSMDNNGRYDSMLFSFTQAIRLDHVQMGWFSGDSDITILAYTGALDASGNIPSAKLVGLTYSQLTANGWSLINDYANVGTGKYEVNQGDVYAKHWLIGAYNPLGGSVKSGFDQGNDNVKVKYLFGEVQTSSSSSSGGQVPEPGSMLLAGLAMLALAWSRRRV